MVRVLELEASSPSTILARFLALALSASLSGGCYALRPSRGGAQIEREDARRPSYDPEDVAVPRGYRVTLVASQLDMPTGVCFDAENRPCVVEAG